MSGFSGYKGLALLTTHLLASLPYAVQTTNHIEPPAPPSDESRQVKRREARKRAKAARRITKKGAPK